MHVGLSLSAFCLHPFLSISVSLSLHLYLLVFIYSYLLYSRSTISCVVPVCTFALFYIFLCLTMLVFTVLISIPFLASFFYFLFLCLSLFSNLFFFGAGPGSLSAFVYCHSSLCFCVSFYLVSSVSFQHRFQSPTLSQFLSLSLYVLC